MIITLRDRLVKVANIEVLPSEPDSGIFTDWVDGFDIFDLDGNQLPWVLSLDEEDFVIEKILQHRSGLED